MKRISLLFNYSSRASTVNILLNQPVASLRFVRPRCLRLVIFPRGPGKPQPIDLDLGECDVCAGPCRPVEKSARSSARGKVILRSGRFTDTLIQRNAQWKCVDSHATLISP